MKDLTIIDSLIESFGNISKGLDKQMDEIKTQKCRMLDVSILPLQGVQIAIMSETNRLQDVKLNLLKKKCDEAKI